jgi:hypothetical protein
LIATGQRGISHKSATPPRRFGCTNRNYLQVAVWMGHSPTVLLDTYGHIIDDLDPGKKVDAARLIASARNPQ